MISYKHLKECHQIISMGNLDTNKKTPFITDTRMYKNDAAFIAIPGQKVNPLNMISGILDKGCSTVFYQNEVENREIIEKLSKLYESVDFVAVKDSVSFIQELAHEHVKEWLANKDHTLFAISGSNGKTTHKEMLGHIMDTILPGKIVSTQKNNNNHLGVPLTLLDINDKTEFVILELGSNHPGEIKFLCDVAKPNAGLTTNIGATHLEFFGTEKAVFEEEGYLYYAVKDNTQGKGFYLINNDDVFLKSFANTSGSVRFGVTGAVDAPMEILSNGAKLGGLEVHNVNITGNHNKSNLATCAYIANHFYPELRSQIIEAAKTFRPTANRSEWKVIKESDVYLDAYNANPSSMRVALEGFKEHLVTSGVSLDESVVVLGDMNELGDNSAQYHLETGKFVNALGFNNVVFIGRYSKSYLEGCKQAHIYNEAANFKVAYQEKYLTKYKYHFIKGSRSLQLESLIVIT